MRWLSCHHRRRGLSQRGSSLLIERVVAMTLTDPPGEATHWTGRATAKAARVSLHTVQRIWPAHGLQPALGPAV
jgi:hypothetical protein